MSRRPARFTEADLRRALKAAKKYGDNLAVDVLPDGTIRIAPVPPQDGQSPAPSEKRRIVL